MSNLFLQHHGIKGQSWGKRRYQNKDGSLTPAGRIRYLKGEDDESETSSRFDRLTKTSGPASPQKLTKEQYENLSRMGGSTKVDKSKQLSNTSGPITPKKIPKEQYEKLANQVGSVKNATKFQSMGKAAIQKLLSNDSWNKRIKGNEHR